MANETETESTSTVTDAGTEETTSTVTDVAEPKVAAGETKDAKVETKVAAGAETKADPKVEAEKLEKAVAALALKLPEGVDAKHPSVVAFKRLAAEHGLDTLKAQKLYDAHRADLTSQLAEADKAREKGGAEWLANQRKTWRDSLQKDAEYGGAKWSETKAAVSRAFNKYGAADPDLKAFLNDGAGDHPALVKFLARIGRDMAEDNTALKTKPAANGASSTATAELQKFFDKSPELFT